MAFVIWQVNMSITTAGNTQWRPHLTEADVERAYEGTLTKDEYNRILRNTTLQAGSTRPKDKPLVSAPRAPQLNAFMVDQTHAASTDKATVDWNDVEKRYASLVQDVYRKHEKNAFFVAQRLNESA
jgi:hypothetical protein